MLDEYTNAQIRDSMRAAAQADAIIAREECLRCYEYHDQWGEGVQMAKFSNGGGDDFIIVFKGDSAVIKGFDHESEVSPHAQEEYGIYPGIYDSTPEDLLDELRNEALSYEDVTFCIWRQDASGSWSKGPVELDGKNDGSEFLLLRVITSFEGYQSYARDYFEDEFTPELESEAKQFFSNP